MTTPTIIDLGRGAVARVYPTLEGEGGDAPSLSIFALNASGPVHFEVRGTGKLAPLAQGIFQALGLSPADGEAIAGAPDRETERLVGLLDDVAEAIAYQGEDDTAIPGRVAAIVRELAEHRAGYQGDATMTAKALMDASAEVATLKERVGSLEGALNLAGSQMEEAQLEVKRLRDALGANGEGAAEKPKRTRKKADVPAEPDARGRSIVGEVTESSSAVTPDGKWANELQPGERRPEPPATDDGNPARRADEPHLSAEGLAETQRVIEQMDADPLPGGAAFPAAFLRLPAPKLVQGERVVVLVDKPDAPGGWATPEATIETTYPGSSKYLVRIGTAAPVLVDEDRIKGWPQDDATVDAALATPGADTGKLLAPADLTPPGAEAFDPAKHPAPTFTQPEPGETVTDRYVTGEERQALATEAGRLKLPIERMQSLMQQHFGKSTSAELTVTELRKLYDAMAVDCKIPF